MRLTNAYSWLLVFVAIGLLSTQSAWATEKGTSDKPSNQVEFNRDIRPLLSDNCFQCHGNDSSSREADLRLDQAKVATSELPSGATAIVPGDPDESELIVRITESDEDMRMPPPDSGKKLTPDQIELFRRWIKQGAKYRKHWSFEPLSRPETPQVKLQQWPRDDIDRFVLARLESEGLKPSPEADRVSLIRRVTFDLTGLPPTPDEVDTFLRDNSPDAYEKLVDRLLASPRYGEHKARYWLDAVRYADTHGLHLDNYREMWPYRDWVIRAFNSNMPFDQFITEQMAGDLLPNATLEERIASGYNRCNVTTNEGGSISEEVYVRNVVDRVNTFGEVFLGLTVNCAQCHDHKYDPISQKEFYQLFAFFNNLDGHAMDGNVKDHAPYIHAPTPDEQARIDDLKQKVAAAEQERRSRIEKMQPAFLAWLNWRDTTHTIDAGELSSLDDPRGLVAYYPLDEHSGEKVANVVSQEAAGAVKGAAGWTEGRMGGGFHFGDKQYIDLGKVGQLKSNAAISYGGWIRTQGNVDGAAIARMDEKSKLRGYDLFITRRRVAVHMIRSWPQYAIKVITKKEVLKPNQWHHVFVTYNGSEKAKGIRIYVDGQEQPFDIEVDSLNAKGVTKFTVTNSATMKLGRRGDTAPLTNGEIDEVRFYDQELAPHEVAQLARNPETQAILAVDPDSRSPEQIQTLREHYFDLHDSKSRELTEKQESLNEEIRQTVAHSPTTLVFRERKEIRPAYFLERGGYENKRDKVERDTLAVLPPMSADLPRDRLGLAKWLTDPGQPLTSRVLVNRFWQQYFGVGLVKTSENFGLQGDPPSHPQLLDWLASELIRSGWDVKHLHRLIVTSSTYRQSARAAAEAYRSDPENRLFARGPRYRLDAEMLRDQALAVSGLLVNQLGGPSVKPPQPEGLWKAVGYSGSNTVQFKPDTGDKVFRRSVYIFWKRTSPPPYLTICDAPSREESRVRRERTNTPLAALLMMNERQYVQAAGRLAQRAMLEVDGDARQRAAFLYRQAALRDASQQNLETLVSAHEDFLAAYQESPEEAKKLIERAGAKSDASLDPAQLAAWTLVANTVLNLDEVINK